MNKATRIPYIDFLKVVGLTGIIIAHVGSPSWAMMLRSFDVPLMVILSSFLADVSYRKYKSMGGIVSIKQYYISRFKRLVIPTWFFLTLFFVLNFCVTGRLESVNYYVASYCLTRYGIGYVWVILIYLYSAMLVPIFYKLNFSVNSSLIIAVVYIFYETMFALIGNGGGLLGKIVHTTLYYVIPYGLVTFLGFNYCRMSKELKSCIMALSFFVFIIVGMYYWLKTGAFQQVSIAKYPPRLYYLSYGVFCSFILLLLCENHKFAIYQNYFIKWISTHSLWIYLWHILALAAYKALKLPEVWYIKFTIVSALATVDVFVVNKILDIIERKGKIGFLKYLRG